MYDSNEIILLLCISVLLVYQKVIRQKFVKYLMMELEVPKRKIDIEVPMSYFKKGANGRADIVVYGENDEGINVPVMIVECKAPHIPLIDEVWNQVIKYDEILESKLIIITNGFDTYGAIWNEDTNEYYDVEELPTYTQLLKGDNFKFISNEPLEWFRPEFDRLLDDDTIESFFKLGHIGEGTEHYLYPLIINLAGFLHDSRVKFIGDTNLDWINIIEDGHRYTSFGNASGGSWEGDYRYFILEDDDGNNQIVSVSIFGALKCENDPVYGNRKGHTTLVVAIDDFDKRHNSLQLNIDKYTVYKDGMYTIWHDGTMAVGRSGSAKRKDVIDYILTQDETLIDSNGKVILGTFYDEQEIWWNQQNTKNFIKNLIKYTLLRDEYRRIVQKSK